MSTILLAVIVGAFWVFDALRIVHAPARTAGMLLLECCDSLRSGDSPDTRMRTTQNACVMIPR
jgi:hypothetical protein